MNFRIKINSPVFQQTMNFVVKSFFTLLTLLSCFNCSGQEAEVKIVQESSEIYYACLLDYTRDSKMKYLVRESTVNYNHYWKGIELNKLKFSQFHEKPPADTAFIDLFQKFQNLDNSSIDLSFPATCNGITLLNDKQYRKYRRRTNSFYLKPDKKYKDYYGFYEFSKIVISEDFSYAMLYMSHNCDRKGGAGYLLMCSKDKNVWKVKHSILLWIS